MGKTVTKNQILYGPPGTGKTYITKRKALEIVAGKDNVKDENIDDFYKKYKEQIKFVTFHQTFSYEQFVEGISVLTDKDNPEIVKYEIRDGIFKQIANLAKSTISIIAKVHFEKKNSSGSYSFKKQLDDKTFDILKTNQFNVKVFSGTNFLFEETKKEFRSGDELIFKQNNHSKIPENKELIFEIYLNDNEITNNYVLIIDEINRGNISKIFGELITLIEDDKRLGQENEIIVKLPYSQQDFGVPPNLYIIGTMNTADRSLVQLDTALRRRFIFEPMYPKPELINNFEIIKKDDWKNLPEAININDLKTWFIQLNKYIKSTIDKEHQIGHSYLMKIKDNKDFQFILKYKIIPLLEEYYYHNNNDNLENLKQYCQIEIENEFTQNVPVSQSDLNVELKFNNTSLKFSESLVFLAKEKIPLTTEQIKILRIFVEFFNKNFDVKDLFYSSYKKRKEYGIGLKEVDNKGRNHLWLIFEKYHDVKKIIDDTPFLCFKNDADIMRILNEKGFQQNENFNLNSNGILGKWNDLNVWQVNFRDTKKFIYLPINLDNIETVLDLIVKNNELWKEINA